MNTLPPLRLKDRKLLQEATRRIVAVAKPKRVLLFGSAVRRELTRDSDLDILVIMRAPVHRRQMAQKIYRGLRGLGVPIDVVVVTEDDLKRYGTREGTILKPALQEGRVLYEA